MFIIYPWQQQNIRICCNLSTMLSKETSLFSSHLQTLYFVRELVTLFQNIQFPVLFINIFSASVTSSVPSFQLFSVFLFPFYLGALLYFIFLAFYHLSPLQHAQITRVVLFIYFLLRLCQYARSSDQMHTSSFLCSRDTR